MLKIVFFSAFILYGIQVNAQLSRKQLNRMNKSASSLFKGQCPLNIIQWMEVSEGYDKKAMLDIAATLQASAQADAAQLKDIASGTASANVTSKFSKEVNKLASKNVKVSQEFFENYQLMQTPICNLYTAVQTGMYKDNPIALNQAQLKFTELNDQLAKYIQDEKKKDQH